ncbi:hypothetical protein HYH03_004797 [Edaphochlamys debaryana]|uniref:Uncharacterized protein n=1 Tax=Edaphochlamys debaryana TaxID=47281 RepID=A0A835Y707_9CHLO|nr:hypothetical protein HYH03_004797 [Edaphochlamys debaryana]|eukprot:KAG2497208.1 hypothetical protein HYH03_004797 [Edaphochlamys debaryana]
MGPSRTLVTALSLALPALGAARSLLQVQDDVVLTVQVNGQEVEVHALPSTKVYAASLEGGSSPSASPSPSPAPSNTNTSAPSPSGKSGGDISYSEMGLIIGLVVGTLFLVFVAVVGWIVYDMVKDKRRRRSLRRLSNDGSGREARLIGSSEEAANAAQGLPAGQQWTSVHDGIGNVGLELEEDAEGAGDSATGQHPQGALTGAMARLGAALTSIFRWRWDWRQQVSKPLDPLTCSAAERPGSTAGTHRSADSQSDSSVVVELAPIGPTASATAAAAAAAAEVQQQGEIVPDAPEAPGKALVPATLVIPVTAVAVPAAKAAETGAGAVECAADAVDAVEVVSEGGSSAAKTSVSGDGCCMVGVAGAPVALLASPRGTDDAAKAAADVVVTATAEAPKVAAADAVIPPVAAPLV